MDPQDHQPVTTSSRVSSSSQIDYALLQQHFHLPISEVAKELGVCATVLKKLCRKHGIPRWPHRKVFFIFFYLFIFSFHSYFFFYKKID